MSEAPFEHSSQRAVRTSDAPKHLCVGCQERKARFRYRGRVKADRQHTYCFECYRSARDRRRAQLLAEVTPAPLRSPFAPARELTDTQVAHRRRMLAHLQQRSDYRAG